MTTEEFIQLTIKSGLADERELRGCLVDYQNAYPMLAQLNDARQFAEYLTERRILTNWQCSKLAGGMYKGFFVKGYRLMGKLGDHDPNHRFIASRNETGELVEMIICPIPPSFCYYVFPLNALLDAGMQP